MIKTWLVCVLMWLLPLLSYAQQGHNVGPIDSVVMFKSMDIACDMIRVIEAKQDSFKNMKGDFYLADEDSNSYYNATGMGMCTESKYVEVKASGAVAFVANWLNNNGDHSPMYALDGFTLYIAKVPEGTGYEMERKPEQGPGPNDMTYYMKEKGADGRRVARFIYNHLFRESTFIVD